MILSVAAGILSLDDKILICQRSAEDGNHPLKWEFPGGKQLENESPEDALIRELNEELGVQVMEMEEVMNYETSYPGRTVHLHFFRISDFVGRARNHVFESIRWVRLEQLNDFDFLEGDRKIVGALTEGKVRLSNPCLNCGLLKL